MKVCTFLITLLISSLVFAKSDEVNDKDKTDSYKIIVKGKETGTVTVSSRFTGDGMVEPTEIKLDIKCADGLKLDEKFKKNTILHAYDYGEDGKLSEWNAETTTVTIFTRKAIINDESHPVINKSETFPINVRDACKK